MKKLFILLAMLGSNAYAQPCPSIFADPYTECGSTNIFLNATPGFATYSWSPAGSVSNPNIANPSTTIPGTYTVTATVLNGPELVVNGDFSAGNTGFTSGQTYTTWYNPCNYYVGPGWFSPVLNSNMPDHTPTSDNMYMSVDGCTTSDILWSETMMISNNTTYTFSFWATDAYVAQPTYEIHFIGDVTGDNIVSTQAGIPAPGNVWNWNQYQVTCWNSGQDNKVTIVIKNLGTAGYGNDFGMDDFSFRQCCTSSYTFTTPSAPMGPNLFVNGDFSLGNIGFTSGQTYTTTYSPCNYYVGPGFFSNTYNPSQPDHTPSADNMFMSVDGCTSVTKLWEETVNVSNNTIYQFNFWATDAYLTQPNYEIHFIGDVSGDNIVNTVAGIPGTPTSWNWNEYGVMCWNSGPDNKVIVRIFNLQTAYNGNDFGMDDFSFRKCCDGNCCAQFNQRRANTATHTAAPTNTVNLNPNPNSGSFEISLANPSGEAKVEIFNVLGEKVDVFNFNGNSYHYAPKNVLIPGVYIVHISSGGEQFTKQIIVK